MSVYVDPLCNHGWVLHGRATLSCHLFAIGSDARRELLTFARQLGLSTGWLQGENRLPPFPHFDLVPRLREKAVRAGAQELSREEAVSLWRGTEAERKEGGA